MIDSLELINFQAHKHSKLDLHKGINVFTGNSTAGKSSLIRAINWVYSNTPRGNNMISFWNRTKKTEPINETSACVTVDGKPIKRIKTASRNGYDLLGEELGAIGSGTPDKVSTELNLTDISFQSQHSPHFLLSQSSGEVSTYLNKVLNLSVIDDTLTKVNGSLRECKQSKDNVSTEIEEIDTQLGSLTYIDDLLPLVDRHHTLFAMIESSDKKIEDLDQLIDTIMGLQESRKPLEGLLRIKPIMERYHMYKQEIAATENIVQSLTTLVHTIKTYRDRIAKGEDAVEMLKSKLPDTCPICGGEL